MTTEETGPKWQALDETSRRVLGVLIEKAKTTPDNYPISLAALTAGCNQKSNRAPQMQLDDDDVHIALDELRTAGVAVEVQGGTRVSKYRHTAYEWFDVKGGEIAVLTELLLRGPQTLGEIRTRASRMAPFKDMAELQPVIELLESKKLVFPLTPPGRGQLFSHNLYLEYELKQIKESSGKTSKSSAETSASPSTARSTTPSELEALRAEVKELADVVAVLKERLDALES